MIYSHLFQTPVNSPQHMPSTTTTTSAILPSNDLNVDSIDSTHPDRVIFRGGNQNSTNGPSDGTFPIANDDSERIIAEEDEPIAPIRPPIHSKTKNWYSIFCNRWASLVGVNVMTSIPELKQSFSLSITL